MHPSVQQIAQHIYEINIDAIMDTIKMEYRLLRRAVRATMVLVPLFGLHFLFLSYHPPKDCHVLLIYNITTYSLDGLQVSI